MPARRATLVLAWAMVLAAAMFGSPSLYVPGVGLLVALGAARLWVRLAARRIRIEHQPGPLTVIEDEPYPLRLVVRGGGVTLPAGSVTHPLARGPAPLTRRVDSTTELEIAFPRRGWQRIEPATLVISDPLGLAVARVRATGPPRVLVLPRIEDLAPVSRTMDGADSATGGGTYAAHGDGLGKRALDFEVDGLRAYRPGAPASRIHWPILARTGELVERRLVGGADTSPVVVLDSELPLDTRVLDRAVRAAASLCFHLAHAGGCLLILPGERTPRQIDRELRAWPQAHARLAMVEATGSRHNPHVAFRARTVFWVSATGTIPRLPALAGAANYLVTATPVDELGDPAFTIAGCGAHNLGTAVERAKARAA